MIAHRTIRIIAIHFLAVAAIALPAFASAAAESSASGTPSIAVMPADGVETITRMIGTAAKGIEIAMNRLDDERVLSAIKSAAARGVKVRIILDKRPDEAAGSPRKISALIEGTGAFLSWGNPAFPMILQNTISIDSRSAYISTFDFTPESMDGTRGFIVRILDPREVSEISRIFGADWNGSRSNSVERDLAWAPNGFSKKLHDLIRGSLHSINIYAERIGDESLVRSIAAATKRGVIVRVLVAEEGAKESGPGMVELMKAGAYVRTMKAPRLRANALLSDAGRKSAMAFVSRVDFTQRSMDEARGVAAILRDPKKIAPISRAFAEDYARAK